MAERKIVFDDDPSAGRWLTHEGERSNKVELTPDWVMIGVAHQDRVTIYASRALSSASLRQSVRHFDTLNWERIETGELGAAPVRLNATLHEIVIAHGDTYGEALADLAKTWSPDDMGSTEWRQRTESLKELAGEIEAEPVRIDDDIIDAEVVDE